MDTNDNSSLKSDSNSKISTFPNKSANKMKIKNSIKSEIINWAILICLIVVLRSSVFGHYLIPTGSMLPSIKLNDHVIANKLAYGLILPFDETQVFNWSKPQRGDIVLFKSKQQDITLIKRVIGIEGDTISFKSGTLYVNNKPVKEEEVQDRSILNDLGEQDDNGEKLSPDNYNLYLESELGSKANDEHYILRNKYNSFTSSDTREFLVPAGNVLCLGDNRDHSNDGRFWGMLETNKIYGKAMFISYSTNPASTSFFPEFRTDRFFKSLK